MFERFTPSPADDIMKVGQMCRADTRAEKVDLGIGVYKDATGATVVLPSVKTAEARLLSEQATKTYVGLAGDAGFNTAMAELFLGAALVPELTSVVQTPGGSGALRLLFEAIEVVRPEATVWLPDPTWGNHAPIIDKVGLKRGTYRYYDATTGAVDFDGMMAALRDVPAGDVVLLHGCCHNPTGANLTLLQWLKVGDLIVSQGLLPVVDLAYLGFGAGIEEDAAGLRALYAMVPEMLIAGSCSKSFAIYRERTGVVIAKSANAEIAAKSFAMLQQLARVNHSMPPDHGAAVVREILCDPALRQQWEAELSEMRARLVQLREGFAAVLREAVGDGLFDAVASQRGMFSLLPISPEAVTRLREDHAIYLVSDGRFNVAGLSEANIPRLAKAIADLC